jgi:hypothetical protein
MSCRSIQSCYIRIISPNFLINVDCRNTKIRYVKTLVRLQLPRCLKKSSSCVSNTCNPLTIKMTNTRKVKSKFHPIAGQDGRDGEHMYMYKSTFSLTSALNGVGGWRHNPAALSPEITRFALHARVRKISPPPELELLTVKPVASRYPGPYILKVQVNYFG